MGGRKGLRRKGLQDNGWNDDVRVTYRPTLKKIEKKIISGLAARSFPKTRSGFPAIGLAVAHLLRAGLRCLHLHPPAEEHADPIPPIALPQALQDKLRVPGLRKKLYPINIRANPKTKPKRDQRKDGK